MNTLIEVLHLVTARYSISDVRRLGKKILRKHFPELPEPKFKIVHYSVPDWLGRAVTRWKGTDKDTTIEIHKNTLADEETLHRVLCHELIHHWQHYNTSVEEESKKTHYEKDKEAHGPEFLEKAKELNKKYGEDYITTTSDETYTLEAGLSSILYHYTTNYPAKEILKDNQFTLATSVGTGSDERFRGNKQKLKFYYLSTTRHKLGGYHLDSFHGTVFVLDGNKLSQKYSGDPVDYWGPDFWKVKPQKAEAEDRVWSKDPYIKPASKYIKEVHVLKPLDFKSNKDRNQRYLLELLKYAKKLKIPHYVYQDRDAFQILDTRKAVSLEELGLNTTTEPHKYMPTFPRRKQLKEWMELYHVTNEKKLSRRAKYILDTYLRYDYGRDKDLKTKFSNGIHNNKKSEEVHSIIKLMQKHKWTKLGDFLDHLKEKWREKDA